MIVAWSMNLLASSGDSDGRLVYELVGVVLVAHLAETALSLLLLLSSSCTFTGVRLLVFTRKSCGLHTLHTAHFATSTCSTLLPPLRRRLATSDPVELELEAFLYLVLHSVFIRPWSSAARKRT